MAFQIGAIPFNQSSGVGEGLNAAAQNFLRAYQMRQQRKLQEQQAATQQQQATLQTQAMQREAQMAPLREALARAQAFQSGVKPAETASDTTFNLPTINTLGAPVVNAPALTVAKDERFVPLGGGTLPIADVSDATKRGLTEQGGFVFDTLDNPVARANNAQAAENAARVESAREQARQALQMLYTREGLASQRQNSQNQFTAGQSAAARDFTAQQNALNRANAEKLAAMRAASTGGTTGLGKPTEFNMKTALVAPRAASAAETITALEAKGVKPSAFSAFARKVPILGQFVVPADQQRLFQAGDVLSTAILRPESGANVPDQERESYEKQFLPQPFDADSTLARKAEDRAIQIRQLNAAAAPALARQQAQAAPEGNRDAALARAMALRLKAQGLSDDQIVAKLRENGFEVEP